MRSLVGLFANGGAVANVWQRIPFYVRAPFVVGIVLLASAELVRDLNISFRSGRVAEGQAVDADAKIADPNATRAAVLAGKPVTGAERTIAAQVAGLDADADQKRATADAANESEDELLAKAKRGKKLTSTEQLRLRELQLKEKELAIREQELAIKTAEASAAVNKADVQNMIYGSILGDNRGLDGVIEAGKRQAACSPIGGARPPGGCGVSGYTQRKFDESMQEMTGQRPAQTRRDPGGEYYRRMMNAADKMSGERPQSRLDPGEVVRRLEGRLSDPFK